MTPSPALRATTPTIIDIQNEANKERVIDILAAAFSRTTIIRALLIEMDKIPPPYPPPALDLPRFRRYYHTRITDLACKSGVEFVEAGNFSVIAICETACSLPTIDPNEQKDLARPLMNEWNAKLREVQQQYIGARSYYHLAYLARNNEIEHIQGAISAVVRPWLKRAEQEGVLVWLEAVSERAKLIYEYFGFRTIEPIKVGEGTYSSDGWPQGGKEGLVLYAMAYDRHLRPEDR